jgi:hypothetical protein
LPKKKHIRGWGFVELVHLKIKENIDEKMNLYIGSSFSSLCNNATNNDNRENCNHDNATKKKIVGNK